jgi:hypothetical protein
MIRFFALYHGLVANAPWGVAGERKQGTPQFEVLLLCRTEREAAEYAAVMSKGSAVESGRGERVASRTTGTK